MQGALYFPSIGVPEGEWLMRALLYWDQLGTIIPSGLDPNERSSLTAELLDKELLKGVEPWMGYYPRAFDEWLNQLPESEVARRREDFSNGQFRKIHWDKWAMYGGGLGQARGAGLAREDSEWIDVETATADEFMAGLALGLCHPDAQLSGTTDHRWFPTTDSVAAANAMFAAIPAGAAPRPLQLRVHGELRAAELRADVLKAALPVPVSSISVDDLLTFRKKRGDLLPRLRRTLEARLDQVTYEPDEEQAQRLADRLVDEARELTAPARAYMKESGMRAVRDSPLVRIAKHIPGIGPLVAAGQELADDHATADPHASTEPLAYLVFAQADLLRARRHRSTTSTMLVENYA